MSPFPIPSLTPIMQDPDVVSEELELRNVLMLALSCPLDSMSIASTDTLSSCSPGPDGPDYNPEPGLPRELVELIMGRVIGKHLHEWVKSSMTPRDTSYQRLGSHFDPLFHEFWALVADLMLVSSTFHDNVSRLVRIAFGIPLPLVEDGIDECLVHQVHKQLQSLFYFGSAILRDAFQAPPASWEPLMKVYGNYIILLKCLFWRSPSVPPPMDVKAVCEELYVHLSICYRHGLPTSLTEDLVQAIGQIMEVSY